jgi:hypothetical protein
MRTKFFARLAALLLAPITAFAAQIIVVPGDPPGQGFNDPTPAVPVGGNPGTTVGQQALNVFQRAADIWGSKLQSTQPITVIAFFTPLNCTAASGVLGAAGAYWSIANVAGVNGGRDLPANTWHAIALAEKITRVNIDPDPAEPFEIFALFNNRLGQPDCLAGSGWYYGLDNAEPGSSIDLLAVVLHEFGHGLGFSVGPTSGNTGARSAGLPSVWEQFMLDVSTGKRWIDMTSAERAASARNDGNLVWAGQKASNVVPSVLDFRIDMDVVRPTGIPSTEVVAASFGPTFGNAPGQRIGGNLAIALDAGASSIDGCTAITNPAAVAGRIALIDRGTCAFTVKVKNAQDAGAAAVLIANNASTGLPGMGGADPSIVIPSFGISQASGAALRAAGSDVYVELSRNPNNRAGTTAGLPRLFAPNPFQSGSSVSHWDTSATRNLLMEPSINGNLTKSVKNPEDLTRALFMDIGW